VYIYIYILLLTSHGIKHEFWINDGKMTFKYLFIMKNILLICIDRDIKTYGY